MHKLFLLHKKIFLAGQQPLQSRKCRQKRQKSVSQNVVYRSTSDDDIQGARKRQNEVFIVMRQNVKMSATKLSIKPTSKTEKVLH